MGTAAPLHPSSPTPFDPNRTDKQFIDEGFVVPCRICWDAYREVVYTARYCVRCEKAACQSKHLTFHFNKAAFCVVHGGKG